MTAMRIAIVGAGIAGLSLAHELRRRGHDDLVLLERASAFEHVGAGVHLGPWGMAVLQDNGLAEALRVRGVPFETRTYFDGAGQLLGRLDLGDLAQRHGAPASVYVHRADLHTVLADAVSSDAVVHGVEITSLIEDDHGVHVHTAGHGVIDADLLVGCDGIRSQVRQHMLGVPAIPLARRALRTIIAAPGGVADPEIYRGVGSTIGLGRIDQQGSLYVWVHMPSLPLASDGADTVTGDPRAELLAVLGTYDAPRMREIEAGVAGADVIASELFEVIVPSIWRGRSVLTGDAAHAMSPSTGLGVTMALEDAAILARMLTEVTRGGMTLPEGLDRYARRRLPRIEAARAQARYTDYDGQLTSPELCRIRDERFARLLAKPDAFAAEVTGILDLER